MQRCGEWICGSVRCWIVRSVSTAAWVSCLLLALLTMGARASTALLLIKDFEGFQKQTNDTGTIQDWISPNIEAPFPWEELVASWNLRSSGSIEIRAQCGWPEGGTKEYILGKWSNDAGGVRESVPHQRDADAKVLTDTLVVTHAPKSFRLHLVVGRGTNDWPVVSLAALSFWAAPARLPEQPTAPMAIAPIDVPTRSQAEFPEGINSWCSPTSTSMLMAYWSGRSNRADLIYTVPEAARAVNDPQWPGTGNWPFNMALAGSKPGFRACVTRLNDVEGLVSLIRDGIPVAASVSYNLLRGKPKGNDGHLIVVRGFDGKGNIEINDPGVGIERVRRSFPIADFLRAWDDSNRTVYLIWPEAMSLPPEVGARWLRLGL